LPPTASTRAGCENPGAPVSKRIPRTKNYEDGCEGQRGSTEFCYAKRVLLQRNDANQSTDPVTTVSHLSVSTSSPTRCQAPSVAHGRCCLIFDLDCRSSSGRSVVLCCRRCARRLSSQMVQAQARSEGPMLMTPVQGLQHWFDRPPVRFSPDRTHIQLYLTLSGTNCSKGLSSSGTSNDHRRFLTRNTQNPSKFIRLP